MVHKTYKLMTKEEIASIISYCSENGIPYKTRLAELNIPAWKFYEFKGRYAKEQSQGSFAGEFLQLKSGDGLVPMPSFAAKTGRGFSKKKDAQPSSMVSIELRTANGTMMRIQGEITPQYLQAIIQASTGRV